eukprot:SAG11_NODE_254_length_11587_cov_4.312913_16_plen_556_part_00
MQEVAAVKTKMPAGEETLKASDGLAPARCGGLMMSLFTPRLAAPGAGRGTNTMAAADRAAEQKFAAAGEALRVEQSRMGACGGRQGLIAWSSSSAGYAAPGTLIPGGAAARRSPRHARRGGCQVACSTARTALKEAEAAARRIEAKYEVDYDLIYTTMRLAPSFGRTRGQLRGAAGHSIEWPACRTRASLVEAEEAAVTAELAWRLSEQSLGVLYSKCAQVRRCVLDVEEELSALRRPRRTGVSSCAARRVGSKKERARRASEVLVAEIAAALAVVLSRACGMLDRSYWGVWGSARRCRASAREVRALAEAVREAEWGTWWEDLPGGSTWMEAAAAALGAYARLGGDAHTARVGCDAGVAAGHADHFVDVSSRDGGDGDGACDDGSVGMVVGRQAADGDCASEVWRSNVRSGSTWRLQPGLEDPHEVAWRCLEVAWQQVTNKQRRTLLQEGVAEDAAMGVGIAPVRMRLWQSLKYWRRRRLRRSFGREGGQAGARRRSLAFWSWRALERSFGPEGGRSSWSMEAKLGEWSWRAQKWCCPRAVDNIIDNITIEQTR